MEWKGYDSNGNIICCYQISAQPPLGKLFTKFPRGGSFGKRENIYKSYKKK